MKDWSPKYTKNLLKLNNKKMTNLIKQWAKDLISHLTTEDTHIDEKQAHEKMFNAE